jgi:prefoldin subunit 5
MVTTSKTADNLLVRVDRFLNGVLTGDKAVDEEIQEEDIPDDELDLKRKIEEVETLIDELGDKDNKLTKEINQLKEKYEDKIRKASEADHPRADRYKREAMRLRNERKRKEKLHNDILNRFSSLLDFLDTAKQTRNQIEVNRKIADIDPAIEQMREQVEEVEELRREFDMQMDELDNIGFSDTGRPGWEEVERDIAEHSTGDIGEGLDTGSVRTESPEENKGDDEDDEFAYEGL